MISLTLLLLGCVDALFQPATPARDTLRVLPPEPAIDRSACEDPVQVEPIAGPDCATRRIACGDTVIGHTLGGVHRYDTRFYERTFCAPALIDHDGGDERVYQFTMPPGDRIARITLETPCADLTLAAMAWDGDACPPGDTRDLTACEMLPKKGLSRETVDLWSDGGATWWIAVEGRDDEEGAFAIHVQCVEERGSFALPRPLRRR